ncbi:RNB domain-containing ribonuclease [Micromonospora sp. NBC_01796]|uniref:RNB domain-containing ribonuclease n=1 Tax=Micromonospora sp. NBC_01796 TaxID=2975987 RepID=UPI002DDC7F79|nr:RNB domain-containing ribonuclease [Micromonospora sp. NBC_01796]WSA83260.1 RNB domain-containing ribonuclease [Micromonospora sp. NBC_01796]
MVIRRVVAPRIDFSALRRELELPTRFPVAAQREADEAATAPPGAAADRTDIPFVTIDPASSRDLDQAMSLTRRPGGGYRVHYAIADVAAHVRPGGELEAETWRRGQTIYLPDGNIPLHPPTLSEGAASLLPDVDRAAVVWTIDLAADGETVAVGLERARVRSRAKLDYVGVQADADAGRLAEPIALLPELGKLLIARGLDRGAINLPLPEQDIEPEDGGWRLVLRAPVPMEDYNAQISLLTGMAAGDLMLAGGVGLLRTMPTPKPEAVARLRTAAGVLGIDWPDGASVGQVLATIDPAQPRAAAFLDHAAELMRGAGYTAFDGDLPADPRHGAVGAAYAHVTAPLRRLADRYVTEVCLALHAGTAVPDWARTALPQLPGVMSGTDRVASAATRAAVELTEAVLLEDRVGETFEAGVLDVDRVPAPPATGATTDAAAPAPVVRQSGKPARRPGGTVALDEPPVRARCEGDLPLGERVRVRLVTADPVARKVLFALD